MWLKVVPILSWFWIVDCATQIGFFTPQYAILDPSTGRTIRQKISRDQIQQYRELAISQREGRNLRPEREISSHYLSPLGDVVNEKEATKRFQKRQRDKKQRYQLPLSPHKPNPTYFHEGIGDHDSGLLTNSIHQDPESYSPASTPTFLRNTNVPNIFDSLKSTAFSDFGSGFFPYAELSADSVPTSPRVERNPLPVEEYTFVEAPTLSSYQTQNNENQFNGNQPAYKWRQRYPIYGRRKRSAQSDIFDDLSDAGRPQTRRQTSWVLLDPLTGRPRNNPYKAEPTSFQDESFLSQPSQRVTRFQPSPLLDEDVDSFPQNDSRESGRYNRQGAPIYRYYKKYPYSG
ncbi:hypothetical protein TCAL_07754 [Tigriopus californicus]|uniref:Uncharacterized protein n=1 Tax=Tigriopus californicus TaxID=6832 RepID=A0A553PT83_TIGCA|nr:uncharacterized protein LOC131892174 [Tigriopus californicus]TRY80893.1 hypothetical protein TCAL_07754 [Tigriopus californicus]|eukprot:TCALIF_07754-PA protein Name:"Protein of unknown function" AED:0.00 eAED:0.00 QI:21/1/1/1/1/1/5/33/344